MGENGEVIWEGHGSPVHTEDWRLVQQLSLSEAEKDAQLAPRGAADCQSLVTIVLPRGRNCALFL